MANEQNQQAQQPGQPTIEVPVQLVHQLMQLAATRPDILQRLAQMYAQHAAQQQAAQQQGAAPSPQQQQAAAPQQQQQPQPPEWWSKLPAYRRPGPPPPPDTPDPSKTTSPFTQNDATYAAGQAMSASGR